MRLYNNIHFIYYKIIQYLSCTRGFLIPMLNLQIARKTLWARNIMILCVFLSALLRSENNLICVRFGRTQPSNDQFTINKIMCLVFVCYFLLLLLLVFLLTYHSVVVAIVLFIVPASAWWIL